MKTFLKNKNDGFTLMEILVATALFGTIVAALMTMFNYTIKINRRTEALRQATQGMRDMMEFIVKEVRNGQIDYRVQNGDTAMSAVGPCTAPAVAPSSVGKTYSQSSFADNRLGILNETGSAECFYLAYGPGNQAGQSVATYVGAGVFGSSPTSNSSPILAFQKDVPGLPVENMMPSNLSVQKIYFNIRPACDPNSPYCPVPYSGYPKMQPMVDILAEFRVNLPTGETTDIYYQTSVSSTKYDISK